jgi:hypothetical protein
VRRTERRGSCNSRTLGPGITLAVLYEVGLSSPNEQNPCLHEGEEGTLINAYLH